MTRLLISALVCGLLALPATADLVQNGSFEAGAAIPGSYLTLNAGDSTSITNWTVIGPGTAAIDYIEEYWTASNGARSLDLDGSPGPGGVEQVLATTVGQAYIVTFDMAGNPDGAPTTKTMDVSAIGTLTQSQSFNFDTTGHSKGAMGWETMQWTFTADAPSTVLQFLSTTGGSYGPALDNVSVNVVPLPGAILLGMLGLGAAGVRLRRFA